MCQSQAKATQVSRNRRWRKKKFSLSTSTSISASISISNFLRWGIKWPVLAQFKQQLRWDEAAASMSNMVWRKGDWLSTYLRHFLSARRLELKNKLRKKVSSVEWRYELLWGCHDIEPKVKRQTDCYSTSLRVTKTGKLIIQWLSLSCMMSYPRDCQWHYIIYKVLNPQ